MMQKIVEFKFEMKPQVFLLGILSEKKSSRNNKTIRYMLTVHRENLPMWSLKFKSNLMAHNRSINAYSNVNKFCLTLEER